MQGGDNANVGDAARRAAAKRQTDSQAGHLTRQITEATAGGERWRPEHQRRFHLAGLTQQIGLAAQGQAVRHPVQRLNLLANRPTGRAVPGQQDQAKRRG